MPENVLLFPFCPFCRFCPMDPPSPMRDTMPVAQSQPFYRGPSALYWGLLSVMR